MDEIDAIGGRRFVDLFRFSFSFFPSPFSKRLALEPGLPDFSWHKITKRGKIYQHLPLQDPPKFTQIWIFGLKTNHLATLLRANPTIRVTR
jgi:hypothetical protein